jgi:hypothetical protein
MPHAGSARGGARPHGGGRMRRSSIPRPHKGPHDQATRECLRPGRNGRTLLEARQRLRPRSAANEHRRSPKRAGRDPSNRSTRDRCPPSSIFVRLDARQTPRRIGRAESRADRRQTRRMRWPGALSAQMTRSRRDRRRTPRQASHARRARRDRVRTGMSGKLWCKWRARRSMGAARRARYDDAGGSTRCRNSLASLCTRAR